MTYTEHMEQAMHPVTKALIALAALVTQAAQAQAPHAHGISQLELVMDAGTVLVAVRSASADIVGFEHRPASAAERTAVDAAVTRLRAGEQLFQWPAEAGCRLQAATVESPLLDATDRHAHTDDGHGHDEPHADFHAEYRYQCERPEAVSWMAVSWFEYFPAITRIDVQYVVGARQGAARLSPGSATLSF